MAEKEYAVDFSVIVSLALLQIGRPTVRALDMQVRILLLPQALIEHSHDTWQLKRAEI